MLEKYEAVVETTTGRVKRIKADSKHRYEVRRRDGLLLIYVKDAYEEIIDKHTFVMKNIISWYVPTYASRDSLPQELSNSVMTIEKPFGDDIMNGFAFHLRETNDTLIVHKVDADNVKIHSTLYVLDNIEGWHIKNVNVPRNMRNGMGASC